MAFLHLDPGGLDDLVVLHAGRAGGHTGHAAQAGVEVLNHLVAHRGTVLHLVDEVDPPARGVHLLPPQYVRRAGRQAEAAVHTVAEQVVQRAPGGTEDVTVVAGPPVGTGGMPGPVTAAPGAGLLGVGLLGAGARCWCATTQIPPTNRPGDNR